MRCSTIEKLLPLYVEGDVREGEAGKVQAHLSSCSVCRRVSEEFRASQNLLHSFEAPEFDEEFYEQIRATVLTEITARHFARASFFETLRPFFLKRQAIAAACLLFLVFGALYGLLYRRSSNSSSQMVAVERGIVEINPAGFATVIDNRNAGSAPTGAMLKNNVRTLSTNPRVSSRQKILPGNQSTERREELSSANNAAAPVSTTQAGAGNTGATDRASTQAVARMEIQTSDPNIRIIWLGRKPGE